MFDYRNLRLRSESITGINKTATAHYWLVLLWDGIRRWWLNIRSLVLQVETVKVYQIWTRNISHFGVKMECWNWKFRRLQRKTSICLAVSCSVCCYKIYGFYGCVHRAQTRIWFPNDQKPCLYGWAEDRNGSSVGHRESWLLPATRPYRQPNQLHSSWQADLLSLIGNIVERARIRSASIRVRKAFSCCCGLFFSFPRAEKIIVATHHVPSFELMSAEFDKSGINGWTLAALFSSLKQDKVMPSHCRAASFFYLFIHPLVSPSW